MYQSVRSPQKTIPLIMLKYRIQDQSILYRFFLILKLHALVASASVFKIKLNIFRILWSKNIFYYILKINNFRGDLTDVSAKKRALLVAASTQCASAECHKSQSRSLSASSCSPSIKWTYWTWQWSDHYWIKTFNCSRLTFFSPAATSLLTP